MAISVSSRTQSASRAFRSMGSPSLSAPETIITVAALARRRRSRQPRHCRRFQPLAGIGAAIK
jgi:hypothetical protein